MSKYLLSLFEDCPQKDFQILLSCIRQLSRFERRAFCDSKDRSFLGFHDCFISRLYSPVKSLSEDRDRQSRLCFCHLAETADQLGENDAGVSSGTSERA